MSKFLIEDKNIKNCGMTKKGTKLMYQVNVNAIFLYKNYMYFKTDTIGLIAIKLQLTPVDPLFFACLPDYLAVMHLSFLRNHVTANGEHGMLNSAIRFFSERTLALVSGASLMYYFKKSL